MNHYRVTDWIKTTGDDAKVIDVWYEHCKSLGLKTALYQKTVITQTIKPFVAQAVFVEGMEASEIIKEGSRPHDFIKFEYEYIKGDELVVFYKSADGPVRYDPDTNKQASSV